MFGLATDDPIQNSGFVGIGIGKQSAASGTGGNARGGTKAGLALARPPFAGNADIWGVGFGTSLWRT